MKHVDARSHTNTPCRLARGAKRVPPPSRDRFPTVLRRSLARSILIVGGEKKRIPEVARGCRHVGSSATFGGGGRIRHILVLPTSGHKQSRRAVRLYPDARVVKASGGTRNAVLSGLREIQRFESDDPRS